MERLKNFLENVFFVAISCKTFVKTFFFWRALAFVSLVLGLGLEHSCPWPRECLSSERLSLASDFFVSLASRVSVFGKAVLGLGFFCVLGLEPCVLDSTCDGKTETFLWQHQFTSFCASRSGGICSEFCCLQNCCK